MPIKLKDNRRIRSECQQKQINRTMTHLTNIKEIEQVLTDNRLCLFFIKAPDCGVCNVMLDKVERLADRYPSMFSFYTDIREEPMIAGRFLVFSGPTVLLLMQGKEVYRGSAFINLEELEQKINRYLDELIYETKRRIDDQRDN